MKILKKTFVYKRGKEMEEKMMKDVESQNLNQDNMKNQVVEKKLEEVVEEVVEEKLEEDGEEVVEGETRRGSRKRESEVGETRRGCEDKLEEVVEDKLEGL